MGFSLFGSDPKTELVDSRTAEGKAAQQAILGIGQNWMKPGEAGSQYFDSLAPFYSKVTEMAKPGLEKAQEISQANPLQTLQNLIPGLVSGYGISKSDTGGAYDKAISDLISQFSGFKDQATTEASHKFDIGALTAGAGSGVTSRVADDAYVNALYKPLLAGVTGLETGKASAESALSEDFFKSLFGLETQASSQAGANFSQMVGAPMAELLGIPKQIFGAVGNELDPYKSLTAQAGIFKDIADSKMDVVSDPGSAGLIPSFLQGAANSVLPAIGEAGSGLWNLISGAGSTIGGAGSTAAGAAADVSWADMAPAAAAL